MLYKVAIYKKQAVERGYGKVQPRNPGPQNDQVRPGTMVDQNFNN